MSCITCSRFSSSRLGKMFRKGFASTPLASFVRRSNIQFVSEGSNFALFTIMNNKKAGSTSFHLKELIDETEALRVYRSMLQSEVIDSILYEVQRQGRISFYMTSYGEEAANVGLASGLEPQDMIWPQYRELGLFLYREFTSRMVTDQCVGNKHDIGRGRQMPVHYAFPKGNIQAISSPLGTNILHAAGAGYAFRIQESGKCAVAIFGEGAASEGDFAAGLNFAALRKSSTIFFCRNNGYAISTPVSEQYAGDGIAPRGVAYGVPSIRVDGTDVLAVRQVVRAARQMAIEIGPVLIEVITQRKGHHSTSDDSTKYRDNSKLDFTISPVESFGHALKREGLLSDAMELEWRDDFKKGILDSLKESEKEKKAGVDYMFKDVYDEIPWHIEDQMASLKVHIENNLGEYGTINKFENWGS